MLLDNPTNWDFIELVLVSLGRFCQQNGNSSFPNAFTKIIHILIEHGVFQKVSSVVLQIALSRVTNLGTRESRLNQLVESISFLATEMLVKNPSLACDALGENFFGDISIMKDAPSIRALGQTIMFDNFNEVSILLKNAWDKHVGSKVLKENPVMKEYNENDDQLMMPPPNDFRTLNIMPTPEDMYSNGDPFLRANVVKGSYSDVETYLDVQFRLLREDFFRPIRKALLEYRELRESKKQVFRLDNVRLYNDVLILEPERGMGEDTFVIQFSTKATQRINWEGSKRLIYGSFLLLSADDFKTFLIFTVVDRKPEALQKGLFQAKFEGGSQSPTPALRKQKMVMAESSAFFEAYRPVLLALQKLSPNHFPLKSYILGQNVDPQIPEYLNRTERPLYDLGAGIRIRNTSRNLIALRGRLGGLGGRPLEIPGNNIELANVAILEEDTRPTPDALGLDPSQSKAFYEALTRRVAVIQGPPGTGKTFLGLKIVRALLRNKEHWSASDSSPILVICYTNHALDQFLEGIMSFTNSIVRMGSRSKSEAMQELSLRNWKMKARTTHTRPGYLMHWQRDEWHRLDYLKRKLNDVQSLLKKIEMEGVIHEDSLLKLEVFGKDVYDKLRAMRRLVPSKTGTFVDSILPYWLGLENSTILGEVLQNLRKVDVPTIQRQPTVPTDPSEEEIIEEDDWGKEDVEEMQEQRMMDDTMLDFAWMEEAGKPRKLNQESSDDDSMVPRLAFDLQDLRDHCTYLSYERKKLLHTDMAHFIPNIDFKIEKIRKRIELASALIHIRLPRDGMEGMVSIFYHLTQLPYEVRWKEYLCWRDRAAELLEEQVGQLETKIRVQFQKVKEVEMVETAEIIRAVHVVGITTSGAAKQKAMMEHLQCKIVVVEEAAEVLEAHIVTSLSSSCEHLILIGDHQQLRPSTAVFELSRKYHLDVSLFERMIKNGMEPCILGVQHRMRPEVARLIVPNIYPTLENHKSVERYANVPGMAKNVFFLTHNELERSDKSDQESRSHLNPYEVDLALALTRYLLMQGIKPSQITILTAYAGQLLHFRKVRNNHAVLQDVRISVVDNFQGEENDIIILSLVRSNEDANIGFLKTENRVCVSLSRAKMGFFLIGNMGNLQQCKLWSKIRSVLELNGEVGPYFELQCQVHPQSKIKANQVLDFPPEGGCFARCETEMPCGHVCPKNCHVVDRQHLDQKCFESCKRSCKEGHSCPKKCYVDCKLCETKVTKILPCTHSLTMMCFKEPKDAYCTTKVVKELPLCHHRIEIMCGRDVLKEKCPVKCDKTMDCEHICPLNCHETISHDQVKCLQPCRRTPCPEKHPCSKKCFEDCGDCLVEVVKTLTCGHKKTMMCFAPLKDAYCNVRVEKVLDSCNHIVISECGASTEGFKCNEPCERILCGDGHPCRKRCWESCGPCYVQVKRQLDCGHQANMECHRDPQTTKCKVPKEMTIPDCNHKVQATCGTKLEEIACPVLCDVRLDCGHQCTQKCHLKNDPDHVDYRCDKVCERMKLNCKKDHKCNKKCHEECGQCSIQDFRTLSCGHDIFTECGIDDKDIVCREVVQKTIPDCGHSIQLACHVKPIRKVCKESCDLLLSCGHPCRKQCSLECSSNDCTDLVPIISSNICGHPILKKCNSIHNHGEIATEIEKVESLNTCNVSCEFILQCEHPCKGKCGTCFNGRVHKGCEEKCGRTLVCGHSCKVNCASSCPPCQEKCQYRCEHSRCNKKCGDICKNCIEPCGWSCKHHKCTRRCYAPCNRPRCNEPCELLLNCGHPCIGLCGEKCPLICRVCNKVDIMESVLFGNEEDDDARFIYLEDCGHSIEVGGMDRWMETESNNEEGSVAIQMKSCPRCKTLIRSSFRYGDIIKKSFSDIAWVKEMLINDSPLTTKTLIENLLPKISKLKTVNSKLKMDINNHSIGRNLGDQLVVLQKKLGPIHTGRKGKPKFPLLHSNERFLIEIQVDVIERLLDIIKNVSKNSSAQDESKTTNSSLMHFTMKPALMAEFLDRVERLALSLFSRHRCSPEDPKAFADEVRRLELIRALYILRSVPNYETRATDADRQLENKLLLNVNKLDTHEEAEVKMILEALAKKLNTGLGISEVERREIVAAIGSKKGSWFKCPKGHIYVIDACGGAMEESTCPECGAGIGGRSHALRSDNQLAGEMDGATAPAYPQTAFDMRNYRF